MFTKTHCNVILINNSENLSVIFKNHSEKHQSEVIYCNFEKVYKKKRPLRINFGTVVFAMEYIIIIQ